MLFALVFQRAQRASTYDISAERNVWLQSALRSFAIACDYMETGLFAIVCDLRSAIRDRLRSFAIIWKPAFSSEEYNVVKFRAEFYSGCQAKNKSKNLIDNSTTDLMHA